jgi:dipeptide/tripeptide permease
MMAVGYGLIGVGLALNVVVRNVPALFLGMAVITLGEMIFAPVAAAYVAGLAPSNMRGRYMGGWGMANSLAMSVAPSLGMILFAWNPPVLWLACGGIAWLAALTILSEPPRDNAVLPVPAPLVED